MSRQVAVTNDSTCRPDIVRPPTGVIVNCVNAPWDGGIFSSLRTGWNLKLCCANAGSFALGREVARKILSGTLLILSQHTQGVLYAQIQ